MSVTVNITCVAISLSYFRTTTSSNTSFIAYPWQQNFKHDTIFLKLQKETKVSEGGGVSLINMQCMAPHYLLLDMIIPQERKNINKGYR